MYFRRYDYNFIFIVSSWNCQLTREEIIGWMPRHGSEKKVTKSRAMRENCCAIEASISVCRQAGKINFVYKFKDCFTEATQALNMFITSATWRHARHIYIINQIALHNWICPGIKNKTEMPYTLHFLIERLLNNLINCVMRLCKVWVHFGVAKSFIF